MIKGLDVSHWQGKPIWSEIQKAGYEFAFIKATEGNAFVDSIFSYNWANSKAAGIPRGAYHFFRSAFSGAAQAELFLKTVPNDFELPPVLDLEVMNDASPTLVIQEAQAWLDMIEAALGVKPIIYTGSSLMDPLGRPTQFAQYPLWWAEYDVSAPRNISPWSNWKFWQLSSETDVPGIGRCDVDLFNGTIEDALSLCKNA